MEPCGLGTMGEGSKLVRLIGWRSCWGAYIGGHLVVSESLRNHLTIYSRGTVGVKGWKHEHWVGHVRPKTLQLSVPPQIRAPAKPDAHVLCCRISRDNIPLTRVSFPYFTSSSYPSTTLCHVASHALCSSFGLMSPVESPRSCCHSFTVLACEPQQPKELEQASAALQSFSL